MKKHNVEYLIYDENGDGTLVKAQITQPELVKLLSLDNVELLNVNKFTYPYRPHRRRR